MPSVLFLGMFIGSFCFGILSDRKGRKFSYKICLLMIGVFGLLSAATSSFWLFLCVRVGVGMGSAGAHTAYSLFMELTPAKLRGKVSLFIASWYIPKVNSPLRFWCCC